MNKFGKGGHATRALFRKIAREGIIAWAHDTKQRATSVPDTLRFMREDETMSNEKATAHIGAQVTPTQRAAFDAWCKHNGYSVTQGLRAALAAAIAGFDDIPLRAGNPNFTPSELGASNSDESLDNS